MTRIIAFSLAIVALSMFGKATAEIIVPNGSFESPSIPVEDGFQYNPDGSSWTYGGGISNGTWPANSCGFVVAGEIPDGTQFAFVQQLGNFIETQITIPSDGNYFLSYYAGGRVNNAWNFGGNTSYEVYLDSALLDSGTTTTSAPLTLRDPEQFYANAGDYTLKFLVSAVYGRSDQTAYFDNISITAVPEPGVLSLLLLGGITIGSAVVVRRRRSA